MIVLQLVKTSVGAGWALNQMRYLVQKGYEVHVAIPLGGKFVCEYQESGIYIHPISYDIRHPLRTISRLRAIVEEVQPDIIHSHFYICTILMRLGLRRYPAPRVFQLPGPSHLYYPLTRWAEILLSQKRDFWFGACQLSCNYYLNAGVPSDRVFLSYYQNKNNIAEIELKEDSGALRAELGLDSNAIMIGMISYMYKPKKILFQNRGIKGHEDFIDAIAMASKINPNIYGICVGGAWDGADEYEQKVIQYAKKRTDHVKFCGTRKNVPDIYPEFYCAVQPSHQENLGGAAQAFIYNCPIISTNVGGLTDIVIDGQTGYLVDSQNPKMLSEAIIKAVNNPTKMKEMAAFGRNNYIQLMESNRDSVLIAYDSILNSTKSQ